jgi:murein DD-endopeptidase MepM/ murein hydrolase activator NlpD
MNPISAKGPSDRAKYREQYINALRIQASNNQLNMNANTILKQTGATPTIPTDFRGTTDKYADFEGMKILLESNLKSITNGMNASNIVAQLTPQEVSFATNAFPLIKETLAKRYALGVPADIAVQFIRDLMRKESMTRGVEFGLQQGTGEGILLSSQQILNTLASVKDYDALRVIVQQAPNSSVRSRALSEISQTSSLLPSQSDLSRLDNLSDAETEAQIDEIFSEYYSDFPTTSQLQEAIDELQVAIQARDARATEQEIMDIMELISQSEETKTTLKTTLQEIRRSPEESEEEEVKSEVSDLFAPAEEELLSSDDSAFLGMTISQKQQRIKVLLQQYPDLELANTSSGVKNGQPVNGDTSTSQYPKGDTNLTQLYYQIPQDKRALPSDPTSATTQETGETTEGKGMRRMKGRGLAKARVRKNRLEHLTEGAVERPKPYAPFGRYVIHKFDLEGGKLNMKTPKGGVVKELPSQKISMGLVRVLKTIGKGALPSFDEIKGLAEADKETLHKVITHSRLNDRVSVPTPQSKTDEEKLADRFDILRGEIVAGNDSKTLVKEFKILLMKLLNAGRVPRKEAHDILTDLASIGL